ncbi:hypothetical protein F2Q69_00052481 [Brassica cretica]|uniref:Uncharacterized protein n=1 Tax=Brassica cretica TaxID=69181 RepID=A0A8S9MYI1_BRACR|nr:hypothetical protein F2Q69_00052481 [Brassica cretica]
MGWQRPADSWFRRCGSSLTAAWCDLLSIALRQDDDFISLERDISFVVSRETPASSVSRGMLASSVSRCQFIGTRMKRQLLRENMRFWLQSSSSRVFPTLRMGCRFHVVIQAVKDS